MTAVYSPALGTISLSALERKRTTASDRHHRRLLLTRAQGGEVLVIGSLYCEVAVRWSQTSHQGYPEGGEEAAIARATHKVPHLVNEASNTYHTDFDEGKAASLAQARRA
jgi:hypothetical protein